VAGTTIHLVKLNQSGKVTAKCGALTDTANSTVWYTEATCVKCRPYEYVNDADGNLVKRERVDTTTPPSPKTKVMRRRSRR